MLDLERRLLKNEIDQYIDELDALQQKYADLDAAYKVLSEQIGGIDRNRVVYHIALKKIALRYAQSAHDAKIMQEIAREALNKERFKYYVR